VPYMATGKVIRQRQTIGTVLTYNQLGISLAKVDKCVYGEGENKVYITL